MPIIDRYDAKKRNDERLKQFIVENNLHRCVPEGVVIYYYFDRLENAWRSMTETSMVKFRTVAESKFRGDKSFFRFYEQFNPDKNDGYDRNINGAYRGFSPRPGYLNILVKKLWLEPETYADDERIAANFPFDLVPAYFDILLTSIAGGRQEIKDHIEKCLLHKLYFPEEFRIPAICFYGQGGTGKGLFVEHICKTIFDGQAARSEFAKFFDKRNAILENLIVVYVDECTANAQQTSKLKNYVGQESITTQAMRSDALTGDNLAWYFLSHNRVDRPPVILSGGGKNTDDRRWSVIKHNPGEHLMYWIEQSFDYQVYGKEYGSPEDYHNQNVWKISDQLLVSRWLRSLLIRHGMPLEGQPPDSYHGSDYNDAVSAQRKTHLVLGDVVFKSDFFGRMDTNALFQIYQELGGAEYKDTPTFGKAMAKYVKDECLEDVWSRDDHSASYWYRRKADSIKREDIKSEFGNVSIEITKYVALTKLAETPILPKWQASIEAYAPVDKNRVVKHSGQDTNQMEESNA